MFSELNEQIDFCVILDYERDFEFTKEVIKKSYDDWWDDVDSHEPIAEYIPNELFTQGIGHELYFKDFEEE